MIKNMEDLEMENPGRIKDKKAALESIQKLRGRLPEDFNYKKELEEAREEKHI
jgi:hypothetical protein